MRGGIAYYVVRAGSFSLCAAEAGTRPQPSAVRRKGPAPARPPARPPAPAEEVPGLDQPDRQYPLGRETEDPQGHQLADRSDGRAPGGGLQPSAGHHLDRRPHGHKPRTVQFAVATHANVTVSLASSATTATRSWNERPELSVALPVLERPRYSLGRYRISRARGNAKETCS